MTNERIKELAKAYLLHGRFGNYGEFIEEDHYEFYPDELENFAELIIRECASRVDWILAEGGKTQGDLMKEHFGVE